MWKLGLVSCTFIFFAGAISTVNGDNKNKPTDRVRITAKATKPEPSGKQVVTVTLDIDKGWHVYANPVRNPRYPDNATVIFVKAKVKPREVKVAYPAGTRFEDKSEGVFQIYEGKVNIPVTVRRAADDRSPLEISVRFYTCDATNCLPEGNVKLTVD